MNSTNKHYLLRYSNKEFVLLLKTVGLLWAFVRSQLPWEGEQQMIPDWNEFYQKMTEDKKKQSNSWHPLLASNKSITNKILYRPGNACLSQSKSSRSGFFGNGLGFWSSNLYESPRNVAQPKKCWIEMLHQPSNGLSSCLECVLGSDWEALWISSVKVSYSWGSFGWSRLGERNIDRQALQLWHSCI